MDAISSHLRALLGDGLTMLFTVLRTAVVYLVVGHGPPPGRAAPARQLAPFDLVMLLLLSNAVQNAMIGPDTSLAGGLLAALTLIATNRIVARSRWVRSELEGKPTLLVYQGQAQADHLRSEGISLDELMAAVREHGIGGLRASPRPSWRWTAPSRSCPASKPRFTSSARCAPPATAEAGDPDIGSLAGPA